MDSGRSPSTVIRRHANIRKCLQYAVPDCASLLYANGVALKEIQECLGHSDIGTTSNIYTHLDYSNKVSSANAILPAYPQNTQIGVIGQ